MEQQDTNSHTSNTEASKGNFSGIDIIKQSWDLSSGNRLTINLLAISGFLATVILAYILNSIFSINPNNKNGLFASLVGMIPAIVNAPLYAVVVMTGIEIVRGEKPEFNLTKLSKYFPQMGSLALVSFLYNLSTTIGFILLFVPGLYLSIVLIFALPLVADRKMQPVNALLESLKVTNANFLQVLIAQAILIVMNIAGALILGIGLIWTVPLSTIAFGMMYQKLFDAK